MTSLLRVLGVAVSLALLAIAAWPFVQEKTVSPEQAEPIRHPVVAFSPLPPTNIAAAKSLLERSPFVKGRSPFDRETASVAPRPPADVRLTGVSKLGKDFRASVRIDGQVFSLRKGDQTPIGVVSAIEESAIVIDGVTQQRFEMYNR